MKTMKVIAGAVVVGMGLMVNADTKTTWRDSLGRIQGTEQTDRNGKITYRDAQGRIIGTKSVSTH